MNGHVAMTAMIQKLFDMKSKITRSSHPRDILRMEDIGCAGMEPKKTAEIHRNEDE